MVPRKIQTLGLCSAYQHNCTLLSLWLRYSPKTTFLTFHTEKDWRRTDKQTANELFLISECRSVLKKQLFSFQTVVSINMAENKYLTGYAKLGTSSCKKCKQKIDKGALRIAKLVFNPFSQDGDMKQWFHPTCIFETFVRARASTKKIEDPDDLEGFSDLQQEDKDTILKLIKGNLSTVFVLSIIVQSCTLHYL